MTIQFTTVELQNLVIACIETSISTRHMAKKYGRPEPIPHEEYDALADKLAELNNTLCTKDNNYTLTLEVTI